jgi:carbon monoxide dehydrogenase subunit G
MNARKLFRWIPPLVVAALCAVAPARADSLSNDEAVRLMRGETVVRNQTVEREDARFIGGVAYAIVDGTPDELEAMLDDVGTYARVLPRTKSATRVETRGSDVFVELHQGNVLFETSYTIRLRKDRDHRTVRFWLDPGRPHGIDDAWGFFRYDPMADGRTLLTWGALVDVGPGIVRTFFEERLRSAMMSVPDRVRGYLQKGHALARRP